VDAGQQARAERARRAEITAKHHKLESESQDALASTCTDMGAWAKQHCTPSCYPLEPRDPRAGTRLAGGPVEIQHRVCARATGSGETFIVVDELDAKLATRAYKRRFPRAEQKGSWQAALATWFAEQHKLPRRDAVAITGAWRPTKHPLTGEALRCVTLVHYTKLPRTTLDACGAAGRTACEAGGDAAARAINLVHFRLAEARRLRMAGKDDACQAAALAAIAAARGLPRWRQYAKLNVGEWKEGLAYKTRFDGILDEDELVATAMRMGTEAEQLHAACGGAAARTTPAQEQSFHSCPVTSD
jgi:hypothetical protein